MNIGATIKTIRKEKGLSQGDLAALSGLTQTSISQIETSVHVPSDKHLHVICETLGISKALLLLISMEEIDVPAQNRHLYKDLFPTIKELLIKIF